MGPLDPEKAMGGGIHHPTHPLPLTLVNSQKGSNTRVCVSTYFDTADSKSGNRLVLSDPVSYRRH